MIYRLPPGSGEPYFIDSEDLARLEEAEQQRRTEDYNLRRMKAQAYRENNRNERMILKEQQLEACKEMQVSSCCWSLSNGFDFSLFACK